MLQFFLPQVEKCPTMEATAKRANGNVSVFTGIKKDALLSSCAQMQLGEQSAQPRCLSGGPFYRSALASTTPGIHLGSYSSSQAQSYRLDHIIPFPPLFLTSHFTDGSVCRRVLLRSISHTAVLGAGPGTGCLSHAGGRNGTEITCPMMCLSQMNRHN